MRELREFATAVRAARSGNDDAITKAFPDPEPLTGAHDDEWDRSPIW